MFGEVGSILKLKQIFDRDELEVSTVFEYTDILKFIIFWSKFCVWISCRHQLSSIMLIVNILLCCLMFLIVYPRQMVYLKRFYSNPKIERIICLLHDL